MLSKKTLVNVLKFGISAAIIAWLVVQAQRDEGFSQLRAGPQQWPLLAGAWMLAMAAVCITIVRWFLLVRALDLPFRLKDAFRLGFLGYLLNFVSVGSIGGDFFKAVFIAREQPGKRTQAVATVILDRVIGLYTLMLVASAAILVTGLHRQTSSLELQMICRATFTAAAVGSVAFLLLLAPGATSQRAIGLANKMPLVGKTLASLLGAMAIYRGRARVIAVACLMSLGTHALYTNSFYLLACALTSNHPSLAQHFTIIPLGLAAGGVPLPLGGLGATEYVLDFFYRGISLSSEGLLVCLAYRLTTVGIALVGACIYLGSRREMATMMQSADQQKLPFESPTQPDTAVEEKRAA